VAHRPFLLPSPSRGISCCRQVPRSTCRAVWASEAGPCRHTSIRTRDGLVVGRSPVHAGVHPVGALPSDVGLQVERCPQAESLRTNKVVAVAGTGRGALPSMAAPFGRKPRVRGEPSPPAGRRGDPPCPLASAEARQWVSSRRRSRTGPAGRAGHRKQGLVLRSPTRLGPRPAEALQSDLGLRLRHRLTATRRAKKVAAVARTGETLLPMPRPHVRSFLPRSVVGS
jgi:hypothetical protein